MLKYSFCIFASFLVSPNICVGWTEDMDHAEFIFFGEFKELDSQLSYVNLLKMLINEEFSTHIGTLNVRHDLISTLMI